MTLASSRHDGPERLRPALVANLIAQGAIIVTGGLVRLTGSGLGCSTWPQCEPGSLVPRAQQVQGWHAFVEFGNRLLTFVLAAVAVWVLVAAVRRTGRLVGRPVSSPARVREAAAVAEPYDRRMLLACLVPLLGIVLQAVVGGVTVLMQLDPRTVSPHFLLSVALVAYSAWLLVRFDDGPGALAPVVPERQRLLARAAAGLFALLTVLGTAVTGSGPHSGDSAETVRFGFDPVVTSRLHAASVWLFVAVVVLLVVSSARDAGVPPRFARMWRTTLGLSVLQGVIGYVQYATNLPVPLVALHLLVATALTAHVAFGVLAGRAVRAGSPTAADVPARA